MSFVVIWQTIADLFHRGETFAAILLTLAIFMAILWFVDNFIFYNDIMTRRRKIRQRLDAISAAQESKLPKVPDGANKTLAEAVRHHHSVEIQRQENLAMLALKQIKPFVQTLKGKRPRHNELPERGEIVRIIDPHSEESHWRVDTVELGTTARVILTSCATNIPTQMEMSMNDFLCCAEIYCRATEGNYWRIYLLPQHSSLHRAEQEWHEHRAAFIDKTLPEYYALSPEKQQFAIDKKAAGLRSRHFPPSPPGNDGQTMDRGP